MAIAPYGNPPLTNREAWQIYQSFAADDRLGLVDQEPAGIEKAWIELAATATASPNSGWTPTWRRSPARPEVTTDAAFTQFADLDLRLLTT